MESGAQKKAHLKEYWRKLYQRDKAKFKSKNKAYYEANSAKLRAQKKLYRKQHAEELRIKSQARYWKHRNDPGFLETYRAYNRRNYLKHKERTNEKQKEWREKNKGSIAARCHKRRALQAKATINLANITSWMSDIKRKSHAVCYFCRVRLPVSEIHFDHIVPLSKGGLHAVENLCVSCAPCNLSKYDKSVQAWVRIGQQILSL